MRKYKYTALNVEKKKFTGTFYAENENSLRQQLAQQNLFLVSCKTITDKTPNQFFSVTGKVSSVEITNFCRQFAIMLNSGISILESLAQLKEQNFSGYMKQILYMIYDDVKIGVLLSKAMEKHKKVFPEFFRSMIYVGEISGGLERVLNELAEYYDKEVLLNRKVKSALAYPIFISVLMVAVALVFLLFVIPTFKNTMLKMPGLKLNPISQAVFGISDWIIANGLTVVYIIVLLVAAIFLFLRTEKGKYYFDVFKYKFNLTRYVQINMVASKFTKATGLLLSSGMNLVDALEIVQNVLGNRYAAKEFKQVIEDVRRGSSLTFALGNYNIFPPMLIQMLSTGEETGGIEEVLVRSVNFFDQQVEVALIKVTSLIQPAMLGLLGGVIGLLFIAIYSPMLSIMKLDYSSAGVAMENAMYTVSSAIKDIFGGVAF